MLDVERQDSSKAVDKRMSKKSKHLGRVLSFYDQFPFHHHPFWVGVINGTFTLNQVIQAEKQHYLRTKAGQALRRNSVQFAPSRSPMIFEAALGNYLEEVSPKDSGASHLELIRRLLVIAGVTDGQLRRIKPTAGNVASMALYRDIASRGTACHLIGAGAVEYYYAELSPQIYEAYVNRYGMTAEQAETYRIHGPLDKIHASRAFEVIDEQVSLHGLHAIEQSVRDAFVATSLHYDGMHQAAVDRITYWNGADE